MVTGQQLQVLLASLGAVSYACPCREQLCWGSPSAGAFRAPQEPHIQATVHVVWNWRAWAASAPSLPRLTKPGVLVGLRSQPCHAPPLRYATHTEIHTDTDRYTGTHTDMQIYTQTHTYTGTHMHRCRVCSIDLHRHTCTTHKYTHTQTHTDMQIHTQISTDTQTHAHEDRHTHI